MLSSLMGDVLRFYEPGIIEQIIAGEVEGMQQTHKGLLLSAIFMVIPIVMVFLSQMLTYNTNRWANIILSIFFFGFTLMWLLVKPPPAYKILLGSVGLVSNALIIWYAWKWVA
jgi:glucan phosphoethanolaminetransferase (alkaline phosphatase superfamily)